MRFPFWDYAAECDALVFGAVLTEPGPARWRFAVVPLREGARPARPRGAGSNASPERVCQPGAALGLGRLNVLPGRFERIFRGYTCGAEGLHLKLRSVLQPWDAGPGSVPRDGPETRPAGKRWRTVLYSPGR